MDSGIEDIWTEDRYSHSQFARVVTICANKGEANSGISGPLAHVLKTRNQITVHIAEYLT